MATRAPITLRTPAGPGRGQPRLGADTARARVLALRAAGGSYRIIGRAAGLAPMTIRAIAAGRSLPQQATITAVLALPPGPVPAGRADAGGTRLRLRALHVMGHGSARIARAAGTSAPTIRAVVNGRTQAVTLRLRDQVIAVYDAWWDKQPQQVHARPEGSRHLRPAPRHRWELVPARGPR